MSTTHNISNEPAEELLILQFSYPETLIDGSSASLELPIFLETPMPVVDSQRECSVSYLPSLILTFTLPDNFPEDAPPSVKLVSTGSWLPADVLSDLEANTAALWEEYGHCDILGAYILEVTDVINSNFGLDHIDADHDTFSTLIEFDRKAKHDDFKKSSHECSICFDAKAGH
jgi:E3 ubiquitin-protein ligase RNF14